MDIHCQRCGRVYEFDAARIPHKGLPVKCASCAHVFRVYRPTKTGDAGDAEWKVKQTDGTTYHFRELTTLQRWIVEKKVERRDEISKTGTHWKSLGDIAELSMFFKAVEGQGLTSTEPAETISDDEISVREQPNWSEAEAEATEEPVKEEVQSEFIPPTNLAEEPEKKSYRKYIYLAIAGLVLGTSVSLAYIQGAFKGISDEVPEAAIQQLAAGYKEMLNDTENGLSTAIALFEQTIALKDDYLDAHTALAEGLMRRASIKLEYYGEQQETQNGQEVKDSRKDQARALLISQQSFKREPNNIQAIRALADYYLYEKNVIDFEKLLSKVKPEDKKQKEIQLLKAYKFSDNAEDLQSQADALQRIVKKHPNFVRAEYDLGKTLLSQGKLEDAKKIFSKIVAKNGQHTRAAARIKEADKAIEDANKPKLSYDELIAKASRLQQIDRAKEAIRLFEQAIGVDRTRPEAYAGAGWCYIDLEDIKAAVKNFNLALEWQPNFADAYMGLGETYHADDKNDLALKNYKKYVGLVPNGPETPVAKRMIKLLTP